MGPDYLSCIHIELDGYMFEVVIIQLHQVEEENLLNILQLQIKIITAFRIL